MSHLKRQVVPKEWPIERKGSVYVVRPRAGINNGLPLLVALREIMGLVHNRKEAKQTVHMRQILLNEKPVTDEKSKILLFDTLSILPMKKYYRLELTEDGKFEFREIKENETNRKIAKIINKKMLKGKKTQLNFSDGRNFLSEMKCGVNDSVAINLKEGKIEKCLALKEKSRIVVFAGKHAGEKGEIISLDLEEKTAKVNVDDKEKSILIKQLMVVE